MQILSQCYAGTTESIPTKCGGDAALSLHGSLWPHSIGFEPLLLGFNSLSHQELQQIRPSALQIWVYFSETLATLVLRPAFD